MLQCFSKQLFSCIPFIFTLRPPNIRIHFNIHIGNTSTSVLPSSRGINMIRIAFANRNTHSCCGLFNHTSCFPPLSSSTFFFLQYHWWLMAALLVPVSLIAPKYRLKRLQSVALTMWRMTRSVIWRGRCFVVVKVRINFCNITHVLHWLHLNTQTYYNVPNST